jgi:hypothetical protein
MVSCNSVMDTEPLDKFSENLVWGTRANADAFVYSTYRDIFTSFYIQYTQEEAWTSNNINYSGENLTRDLITRESDYGFNKFAQIRRCNLIIEKAAASTGLTENDKKELVAEGKFLRASVYFWLARRFGIVVWIDRPLTSEEEDYKLPTTPDAKTTYDYIIKDLEDAVAGMPEESLTGRGNKYAAYALLSEVCLQAAAYTGDATLYQKAIDAADAVINSGKYQLDSDYGSIFNENGRYSNEIIFGRYYDSEVTTCGNIRDLQQGVPNVKNQTLINYGGEPLFKVDMIFEAWLEFAPSHNITDQYDVIDQATGKGVSLYESSQYKANVQEAAPPSGYVKEVYVTNGKINDIIYANRDKRFYDSFVYDSCTWFNELVTTNENGNLRRSIENPENERHCTSSGYYWRKGVYTISPRVYIGLPADYHYVIFRLGKLYLNKAEALLQQGKVSEALAALNQTRTIHGQMPEATASNLDEAWKVYKRERRVEMAKEGDVYWTLMRWGKYGGPANGGAAPGGKIAELVEVPLKIDISVDRKRYKLSPITLANNHERAFDESRRYLLPIPQAQRVRNENLGQNPGY